MKTLVVSAASGGMNPLWSPGDLMVLDDHIKPLKIPAWYGAMIGHIEEKFTIPLGIRAEIDADTGSILLLEPSVT